MEEKKSGAKSAKNSNPQSSSSIRTRIHRPEIQREASVRAGVLTQLAASGLIPVMYGSTSKKIFVWHSGFWSKTSTNGWSYERRMVSLNWVIVTTGGGSLRLMPLVK